MTPCSSILITGSSGFVGTTIYDALHRDHSLFGLDISAQCRIPSDKVYGWDDLSILPHTDAIIHLAGVAHDTANTTDESTYFRVNSDLTKQIFDHFLQSNSKIFIFFSSVKAVADTVVGGALKEDAVPAPMTAYGRSKLAAEQYIEAAGKKEGLKDKQVYVLRPSMIHGPGNKGNLNLLYSLVSKGIPWPLGAFENKRSFLAAPNLVFVIRRLLQGDTPQGTYHLADDDTVSTNQLIRLMADTLGRKTRILNISPAIIKIMARAGDLLHLPLNSERLKKLTESYVVSNAKIKHALGIEKLPVDAHKGLSETIKAFQKPQ